MYLYNRDFAKKKTISDSLKDESLLLGDINIENLRTFSGWNEELEKIPKKDRLDIIGVFDFETTHINGRAVSMSIINYSISSGEVLEEKYWEFKNPVPMDPESVKVHGLTEEYLSDKGDFLSLYKTEIEEVIKRSDCMIAHNSAYDVSVLGRELYSYGVKPDYELRVIDSAPMLKQQMSSKIFNLSFCSDFFNVDKTGLDEGLSTDFHNALYDSRILLEVIKKAMNGNK